MFGNYGYRQRRSNIYDLLNERKQMNGDMVMEVTVMVGQLLSHKNARGLKLKVTLCC